MMKYYIWMHLDERLNDLANWLKYSLGFPWLARKIMSDIADSPKDQLIYRELDDLFEITDLERKIIENNAYEWSFIPNSSPILEAQTDSDREEARLRFMREHGITTQDLTWNTEELIYLYNYKKDNGKMKRMYEMLTYYHKNHFLMSIGWRGYE